MTTPVEEPTVARATLLLLQMPPDVALVKVVDVGRVPPHTVLAPLIDGGLAFTVIAFTVVQPPGTV